MTPKSARCRRQCDAPRSGAALVVAMICLLLVTMIATVLVRVVLAQREQLERDGWQQQADWLAISAAERAVQRASAEPAYAGETWLPVRETAGAPIGRVEIAIEQSADGVAGANRTVRITVDVPDDPVDRAHLVREWRLPAGESSSETVEADVVP